MEAGEALTKAVTTALGTVWEIVGDCVTFIADNPVLMVIFVGGCLVPIGFKIFKRAKRSVK